MSTVLLLGTLAPVTAVTHFSVGVVVRARPGAATSAAREVQGLGGKIGLRLGIINGFSASVPRDELARIANEPDVAAVTPDGSVHLMSTVGGFDATSDAGSLYNTEATIHATDLWAQGITGKGVDIATIDSGVVPVNGLTSPGKVVNGADLSYESQAPGLQYLDTFGHGTHMAGIIAGRDDNVSNADDMTNPQNFVGIAPDARIVSVKVANSQGATDVSQVLAAIDWIVEHRNDNGMNIRVLNLSFGTDSTQDYTLDPLAFAAEVAWRSGIVVVVAAGNNGATTTQLSDPARDPYVIAVGADDSKGTADVRDDSIPTWSARGDGVRNPDVVAPGRSIVSLRDPGSYVDQQFPSGYVNDRFFRGSGTSQAAAVVSGSAALLIQQRPDLTPDQVKSLLSSTAVPLPGVPVTQQGAGLIDLASAAAAPAPDAVQTWIQSSGNGSLEAARGSEHVVSPDGVELQGEQDMFGASWSGADWSNASSSDTSWTGGTWNGSAWTGGDWSGASWSGASWSGASWSGASWSGASWSGASWSGASWSGASWSGASWSGASWSGASWSGASWSGASWSGASWSAASWD